MAVVELKDDSQASRLPLVEDGVVGFWRSGGEGNTKRTAISATAIVNVR